MRRDILPVLAIGAAWWLFSDLAAVWGPSLITIFGQAAETPAELMGLFALGCVLSSYVVVALARRLPTAALGIAILCRIVLQFQPGGQVQLYVASLGVAAALAWLSMLVARQASMTAQGICLGWLLSATAAAVGGTWLAVWRLDVTGIGTLGVLLVLNTVGLRVDVGESAPSRRLAWSVLPVGVVAGIAIVNAGRASALNPDHGPTLLVVGCALALMLMSLPLSRFVGLGLTGVGLIAICLSLIVTARRDGIPGVLTDWSELALLVGPAGLAELLRHESGARTSGARAVLGGAVLWVVLFFAYYAGYDLGYRADWLIVGVTAALVIAYGVASVSRIRVVPDQFGAAAATGGVAVVLALLAAPALPSISSSSFAPPELEVVTYNLRMGYGMDGRFDPRAVAEVIGDADVAMLQEVDRGWFLNGGQDQLAILARLTHKNLYFNPAADQIWGDAILTSLPVESVTGEPLSSYDAVTGAGLLALHVDLHGTPMWLMSTHVQPTTAREDGTIDQAREIAALAERGGADERVILAGDFNFEPGSPSFQAILGSGLVDALASQRPVMTSDSVSAEEQIDHVFASSHFATVSASAVDSHASDHLPVRVVLKLRP
jgi:endonuclease/exonuclease/phosphatase family metal-dependent hydrolase